MNKQRRKVSAAVSINLLIMSERHTYQSYEVFYKIDDTPGWKIAIMAGDKQLVEEKCKKLWKVYKIRYESGTLDKLKDVYPFNYRANFIHMRDDIVYSLELDKWFESGEIIPAPDSKCELLNNFVIDYKLYEDYCTIDDLRSTLFESFHGREAVEITVDVTFKAAQMQHTIRFLYAHYYQSDIINFLDSIENNKFSYLIIEEYWFAKIFVWTIGDKCRVKVQDYHTEIVKEPVDFMIDKKTCIDVFAKFFLSLDNEYARLEKMTLDSLTEEDINFLHEQHENIKDFDWHYDF